jgi:hypothetical protein
MAWFGRCASVVALIFATPLVVAEPPYAFATPPGTLPKDVVPVEHTLLIVPDIANRTFRGSQTIRIDVGAASPRGTIDRLREAP